LEPTVKTERQKYVEKLESEIAKATKSKKFIGSEEGQYVIEWLKSLTSDLINQITNHRCEESEYVEKRAQIALLRKLVQVLETQASTSVIAELRDRLNLAVTEE
jgi:hypothetical protein